MDQSLAQKILGKITVAILVIALLDLVYLNWWIIKSEESRVESQSQNESAISQAEETTASPSPQIFESPSPAPSPQTEAKTVETKTVIERQQTIIQTSQKEIFIPMGSGSTKSNTFADLAGTDVTIDTAKYSAIDSVVFEASIWVEGANGKVHAQITNVTDKNPLIESQISSISGTGEVKASGKIPVPPGVKTFRIQAKTDITNFAAHVDNARIKITLK